MDISFPVWLIWDSVRPGRRTLATCIRDGKRCLAVFNNHGAEFQFRVDEGIENDEPDKTETLTPKQLRPFLNGIQYEYAVVNPCSQSETIYSARELCKYVDSLQT